MKKVLLSFLSLFFVFLVPGVALADSGDCESHLGLLHYRSAVPHIRWLHPQDGDRLSRFEARRAVLAGEWVRGSTLSTGAVAEIQPVFPVLTRAVGIYQSSPRGAFVSIRLQGSPERIYLRQGDDQKAVRDLRLSSGDIVWVDRIKMYGNRAFGKIVDVVPRKSQVQTSRKSSKKTDPFAGFPREWDTRWVASEYGVPLKVDPRVNPEASNLIRSPDRLSREIQNEISKGRRDLRGTEFISIDSETTRDRDDLIHVEKLSDGYRIMVAITDVDHWIKEGSIIDQDANNRAVSYYFDDFYLPMIPEKVGTQLLSFDEGVDRLAIVVQMEIDRSGKRRDDSVEVFEAVVRNHRSWNYLDADQSLENHFSLEKEVADLLRRERIARGAFVFDNLEFKPKYGSRVGGVRKIAGFERVLVGHARGIVEEMALAANLGIAHWISRADLPQMLYRFQPPPTPSQFEHVLAYARKLGLKTNLKPEEMDSVATGKLFKSLKDQPLKQEFFVRRVTRYLPLAAYSHQPRRHYGLAEENYIHATSPMRRHSDLTVQRIIKGLMPHRRKRFAQQNKIRLNSLWRMAQHYTARSISYRRAERERRELEILRYLEGRSNLIQAMVVNISPERISMILPSSGFEFSVNADRFAEPPTIGTSVDVLFEGVNLSEKKAYFNYCE